MNLPKSFICNKIHFLTDLISLHFSAAFRGVQNRIHPGLEGSLEGACIKVC
jgi:hypothetical protein